MPCGQQYPTAVVYWFVSLVLRCGASLRCAAKVLEFFGSAEGQDATEPDRSTGRLWLLRIGLAALLRPKTIATDWVWMADHSIQIGRCKVLVILGIRLSEFPQGQPRRHQDMEPIALVPMTSSTKQTVAACLEDAVAKTGVPRAILDDHGTDLHGGVEIFREAHPETGEFYDVKHKAACLLKGLLERSTMEGIRHPVGTDEVRRATDGVSMFDASQSAAQGEVHELGRAGGLGDRDPGVDEQSIKDGGVGASGGVGAGEAELVGGIPGAPWRNGRHALP